MLVLSRRENEKVLFPNLGISVEVARVQGKTVRLGIEAPPEIRVIRGELADCNAVEPESKSNGYGSSHNKVYAYPSPAQREIQKNLDAANLAIHLAQNQLQQRLNDRAEEALENALACLEKLELAVLGSPKHDSAELSVQESRSGYSVHSKLAALATDSTSVGSSNFSYVAA